MPTGDRAARAQISKVLESGVQVEWMECRSFLQWQLAQESAVVQASVAVQPHVVDTAMKFASFLRSPLAQPQGQEGQPQGQELAWSDKDAEARFTPRPLAQDGPLPPRELLGAVLLSECAGVGCVAEPHDDLRERAPLVAGPCGRANDAHHFRERDRELGRSAQAEEDHHDAGDLQGLALGVLGQ